MHSFARVDSRTEFAAITATSLDEHPIGRARRVLLTSVARAENTGQGYAPPAKPRTGNSWSLPADGKPPVLTEPVRARVRIAVPADTRVYALDSTGRRGRQLDAQSAAGSIEFDPSHAASIWCELVSQ